AGKGRGRARRHAAPRRSPTRGGCVRRRGRRADRRGGGPPGSARTRRAGRSSGGTRGCPYNTDLSGPLECGGWTALWILWIGGAPIQINPTRRPAAALQKKGSRFEPKKLAHVAVVLFLAAFRAQVEAQLVDDLDAL